VALALALALAAVRAEVLNVALVRHGGAYDARRARRCAAGVHKARGMRAE